MAIERTSSTTDAASDDRTGASGPSTPPEAVPDLLGPDSEREPVLSVVLPTKNEEAGIAECLDAIYRSLIELDVPGEIVVADSSTDRTPEIAA